MSLRRRPDATRALAALLRGSGDFDGIDAPAIIERARHHDVQLAALDRLHDLDALPADLALARDFIRLTTRGGRLKSLETSERLIDIIPTDFVVFKGPAIACRWYDDPDHRPYSDLDVLVRPTDLRRVVSSLEAAGATHLATNWHGFTRHGVAEIPILLDRMTIDLHWNVIALARDRASLDFDTRELIERSTALEHAELPVPVLDDVDAMLIQCTKVALDGGRRLGGLLDLVRIADGTDIDTDELARRARRSGCEELCAGALERAARVFDDRSTHELAKCFRPWWGWRLGNTIVDTGLARFSSDDSVAPGIWLSSGRSQRTTTLRALADRTSAAINSRRGRPAPTDPEGDLHWRRTSGDPETARAIYFATSSHELRVEE